jgi:hypothetical protein
MNYIGTKFNQLTKFLSGNKGEGTIYYEPQPKQEIIKASSEEELKSKALEKQQQDFINKQWHRVLNSNKDKQLYYEANRIAQYSDYQMMETYPTISAALNLLSEEATTTGQDGKMLTISSSNKAVKKELERLFYNVLDVNTVLQFWARNLVKYGDNFVYLVLDKDKGIVGAKQLTNIDVERKEELEGDRIAVKFKHKNQNGLEQEYTVFQVAHFRLLGDDRRVPYGMSVLDNIRRTWKMLTLVEDSMMVYRISRAAERRVYKIEVGNMPPEDVPAYMEMVASQTKRSRIIDPTTGDFNWKFNVATVDADIYVPVRNGGSGSPIETLAGASNLSDIEDIKYLRENLFTGLGIPSSFLSFVSEGGAGDGKSLSMLDIRFSRKINKIQQALIAELNNLAIIHLAMLGGDFREEITNFSLSLANPSTQAQLLKMEMLGLQLDTYIKAVTPTDSGIKPMSETKAKMEILNYSQDEIIDDLIEQMIESKIGDEIKSSPQLIKSSKVFDSMIKYYNVGFLKSDAQNPEGDGTNVGQAPEMNSLDSMAAGTDMSGGDPMGMGGPPAEPAPMMENYSYYDASNQRTELRQRVKNKKPVRIPSAFLKELEIYMNKNTLNEESIIVSKHLEDLIGEIDNDKMLNNKDV